MATQDLEKLIVKLDADLRSYEKALAKAQGTTVSQMRKMERQVQSSATRIESSFSKMGSTIGRFGKGFLVGLGAASITEIARSFQELISSTAKIGDLGDKIGLTAEEVQELQYGAVQANMDFEEFEKGLLKFSKSLGEAANGSGDLLKQLRANGVEIRNADGTMRPYLELLKDFADLVKNAGSEQDQMLLITQAFGRGGANFLEFLKGGRAGLEQFATTAREAGGVLENEFVSEAQKIDDRWAALMRSLETGTKRTVLNIVKAFEDLGQGLSDPNAKSAFRIMLERLGLAGNLFEPALPTRPVGRHPGRLVRPDQGIGQPTQTTKVVNPEEEAAKKKAAAEVERELARAIREREEAQEDVIDEMIREQDQFDQGFVNIEQSINAMNLEAETLGMTTAEIERARVAQELYNLAQEHGIPITDELSQRIEDAAARFGAAAQHLEEVHAAQERVEELNGALKSSFLSFFSDIADGVKPIDALRNSLMQLAQQLLQLSLSNAFDSFSKTGGSQGFIGAISALVSHRGGKVGSGGQRRAVHPSAFAGAPRMHGGGIAGDEVPTILQKGEVVLPKGFRGGGGSVTNIYTQPGMRVERRESRRGGIRREDLYVIMDDYIGSGRGQRAMGVMYGIRPQRKRH